LRPVGERGEFRPVPPPSPRIPPLLRQLAGGDRLGLGSAARSRRSANLRPRTAEADRVVASICPFCAVGCAQRVYVRDEKVTHIEGEPDDLERAVDMIADRVIETRARTWEDADEDGRPLHRTLGFAHLGGATLDNEENYLLKKGFSALGAVAIENQARI
jgi:formate dehydrogenase major subunit